MQMLEMASLLHVLSFPCRRPDRLSYLSRHDIASSALRCAQKVISNSISNRNATAWVNAVPLLTTAGQSLTDWKERKACATVLQDIQLETGWNTKENVRTLLRSWRWDGFEEDDAWKGIKNYFGNLDPGQQLLKVWEGGASDQRTTVLRSSQHSNPAATHGHTTPNTAYSGVPYMSPSLDSTPSSRA